MDSSTSDRNPFDCLAEEFAQRVRRGEHPPVAEYTDKYPELADEIRRVFPAIVMMERLKPGGRATDGRFSAGPDPPERMGDFRILREIGRGGMGVVYEAEQESLGRRVALKVLSPGAVIDAKQVRRFEREARAAARLHHTNIVPVFGVGEHGGTAYYVMQFIPGLGLDKVLDELRRLHEAQGQSGPASPAASPEPTGHLPPCDYPGTRGLSAATTADVAHSLVADHPVAVPGGKTHSPLTDREHPAALQPAGAGAIRSSGAMAGTSSELSNLSGTDRRFFQSVARIGVQVAGALDYANRQGVLHRDIKPSNLLLDAHGNVWITDFGLAKTADSGDLTHTGDVVGTIRYMAPERFRGTCDARSDLYSLGLTLYELVARRPAFEAPDRHELIRKVMHEDPLPLGNLERSVPWDLETIIAKATAREPQSRYATAGLLAEDLQRFVDDEPIRARRVSQAERFARWCRREPVVASLAGGFAGALLAVAVFALLYADRQTRYGDEQARHAEDQSKAAQKIERMAEQLRSEGEVLKQQQADLKDAVAMKASALAHSNRLLAMNNLELGRAACERSEVGPGLLWFVASLRAATEAGDPAWQRAARANLAAWRSEYPRLKAVFPHGLPIGRVGFSPDGKVVCTETVQETRLWSTDNGLPITDPAINRTRFHGSLPGFSPDGRAHVTGSPGNMTPAPTVAAAGFSPDFKTILMVNPSNQTAALVKDAATGKPIGKPFRHQSSILVAAFSPDGRIIVTGSVDRTARRWSADTGEPIGEPIPHDGPVTAVVFSPDGSSFLTVTSFKTVRIWETATARPTGKPLSHPGVLACAVFGPGGKTLLTAVSGTATVRIWDVATGEAIASPESVVSLFPPAVSPDGKTFLVRTVSSRAQLWDIATGQSIGQPLEHPGGVEAVAFSPDGKTVATTSTNPYEDFRSARLWDTGTAWPVGQPLSHQGRILIVAFSPDGKTVLTGSDDMTARLWDAATGQPIGQPLRHQDKVFVAVFSPDGRAVLTGSDDRTARLWDAASGEPISPPIPHQDIIISLAFSPDGRTVLSGSRDGTARLWAAAGSDNGGLLVRAWPGTDVSTLSPDGRTILTGARNNQIRIWDTVTGYPIGKPLVHRSFVTAVAFSPDSRSIVTGSMDGMVAAWDAATGQRMSQPAEHQAAVRTLAFGPDGKTVLIALTDGTAGLWDAGTGRPIGQPLSPVRVFPWRSPSITGPANAPGQPLRPITHGFQGFLFGPDGRALVIRMEGRAQLWGTVSGLPIGRFPESHGDPLVAAFSPDGRCLATGADDNVARLWNTTTGQPISKLLEHRGPVEAVAFSPDGNLLLTGSQDRTARLWDRSTGQPAGPALVHSFPINHVAFSPDGKTILTSGRVSQARPRLWSAATGQPIGEPLSHPDCPDVVAFGPDGKTVVTQTPAHVRLWDAATGEPIGQPLRHQGDVSTVAFSPDGKTLLVGSTDHGAQLWDTITGVPIGPTLPISSQVVTVAFGPDGKAVLTRGLTHTRLWRLTELPDDLPRLSVWVEMVTGLEMDKQGGIRPLGTEAWNDRRRRLSEMGGPPLAEKN
jgi:WD40 repeat protein